MLILSVDTTSRAGSLALWQDGRVTHTLVGDPSRTHGERLPNEISVLLSQAGLAVKDIDLYAVVTGPGSFTGLRVGIAAVQGLALARGRQVIPIPALNAFASADEVGDGPIAVWRDAQRRQVFAAVFERTGSAIREILEPVSLPPQEVVSNWLAQDVAPSQFIGDGVETYAEVLRDAWPGSHLIVPAPPLAPIGAAIASRYPERAVAPHAIVPIYVRPPDAEIARDRLKRPADER